MFDKFKQLSELKKMRDQALNIQRQLAGEKVEINENGVRIVISGDQQVLELQTNDAGDETVKTVINKALKRAQELAARKLASMSGGLGGLAGMFR